MLFSETLKEIEMPIETEIELKTLILSNVLKVTCFKPALHFIRLACHTQLGISFTAY